MATITDWRPIQDAHAIQMARASVAFGEPIPELAWRKIEVRARAAAERAGLSSTTPVQALVVQFNLGAGAPSLPSPMEQAGVEYRRLERPDFFSEKVQLMRDSITYENWAYTRWAPFRDRLSTLMAEAAEGYARISGMVGLSCEYVDVFEARALNATPDCSAIVRPNSPAVAERAFSPTNQWHTHSGWFEYPDAFTRRLCQIKIDVADAVVSPSDRKRLVQITTHITDQFGQAERESIPDENLTWNFIDGRLHEIHLQLKHMFADVLTEEAAELIALG